MKQPSLARIGHWVAIGDTDLYVNCSVNLGLSTQRKIDFTISNPTDLNYFIALLIFISCSLSCNVGREPPTASQADL